MKKIFTESSLKSIISESIRHILKENQIKNMIVSKLNQVGLNLDGGMDTLQNSEGLEIVDADDNLVAFNQLEYNRLSKYQDNLVLATPEQQSVIEEILPYLQNFWETGTWDDEDEETID